MIGFRLFTQGVMLQRDSRTGAGWRPVRSDLTVRGIGAAGGRSVTVAVVMIGLCGAAFGATTGSSSGPDKPTRTTKAKPAPSLRTTSQGATVVQAGPPSPAVRIPSDTASLVKGIADRVAAGKPSSGRQAKAATVATARSAPVRVRVYGRHGLPSGKLIIVNPAGADAETDSPTGTAASEAPVDLDSLLARLGVGGRRSSAVGGPYVALGAGAPAAADPQALAILETLPLSAPLDQYQFESSFGVRIDPINGHRAVHTGIDLSAAYRAPVYSTSPGAVVFAGYAAGYGRMVEIDHGHGIHTRYAHLNRLLVNVGQTVRQHAEIGLLGSTGRSTGPHVHYEVLVDGVAQNPMHFLEAGKSVELLKAAE